jgi:hypothetical protein
MMEELNGRTGAPIRGALMLCTVFTRLPVREALAHVIISFTSLSIERVPFLISSHSLLLSLIIENAI